MWRDIGKATRTGWKRTARNTSMAQLFGDERCIPAILEFLAQTEVGSTGRLQAGRFWEDLGGAAHRVSNLEDDGDDSGTEYGDGGVSREGEDEVRT
jgi:hypothetical protein